MLIAILFLLGATAGYSGVMWLWLAINGMKQRSRLTYEQLVEIERETFHLGLCFILSIGFLGLLLR